MWHFFSPPDSYHTFMFIIKWNRIVFNDIMNNLSKGGRKVSRACGNECTIKSIYHKKVLHTENDSDVDVDYVYFLHFMMVCRHKTEIIKRTPGVIWWYLNGSVHLFYHRKMCVFMLDCILLRYFWKCEWSLCMNFDAAHFFPF